MKWFITIKKARNKMENRRIEYNTKRPRGSLNGLSLSEFIEILA